MTLACLVLDNICPGSTVFPVFKPLVFKKYHSIRSLVPRPLVFYENLGSELTQPPRPYFKPSL